MTAEPGMYVRCPIIDREYPMDPRDFVMGRVLSRDEEARSIEIEFLDPFKYRNFYPEIPEKLAYPDDMVRHCELYSGSAVMYKGSLCHVLSCVRKKDQKYEYYIERQSDRRVILTEEDKLVAGFINGWVSPKVQIKNYELQNPHWYLRRCVVNKAKKILDNSILGFKELAGCKIFLLPHQVNTVMRCMQEIPCRYMLADEVGMGKTIEAASVLKLYLNANSNRCVMIAVPGPLKEQWKTELFLKFDISTGIDANNNEIVLKAVESITEKDLRTDWDFVIYDEVHRVLHNTDAYDKLHRVSQNANNILVLSATPLQKKSVDYLRLLRILNPSRYDSVSDDEFEKVLKLQSNIVNSMVPILDNMEVLDEDLDAITQDEGNPHEDIECKELFQDITDDLEDLSSMIQDSAFAELLSAIKFEDSDLGLQSMRAAASYVCDNYQLERHIIRNRRNMLFDDATQGQVRPIRHLYKEISYEQNDYEYATYERLNNLIQNDNSRTMNKVAQVYKELLGAFFSSAAAFKNKLDNSSESRLAEDETLTKLTSKWMAFEQDRVEHIDEILADPSSLNDRFSAFLDYLDQELYDQKVVIFTSYNETFGLLRQALEKLYKSSQFSCFCKGMETDELELNVYRFQNDNNCHIMLCDPSGGEGRNFQNADFVIHFDLPWDANEIEQRIGRLDRLERDASRPDVNSIVVFAKDSFDQQIFEFWNKGLNIFSEPLSGLEIILEEINDKIYSAIASDFSFGLYNLTPEIIELTKKLKSDIRREQLYDTVGYLYRPLNSEVRRLINFYNKNENELFARSMMNWASLAGFNPHVEGDTVSFSVNSFSIQSAKNTLLIPPNWNHYMAEKRNQFASKIQALSEGKNSNPTVGNTIRGTFDRKKAISNDYLHFFAPGDDIFDCIIENAERSSKGQCSAFAVLSDIDWKGFIYSYSAVPNEEILYRNNISPAEITAFRNYLTSEIVDIPVARDDFVDVPDEIVIRLYHEMLALRNSELYKCVDHLGKRGKGSSGFLGIPHRFSVSNLEFFKSKYPKDIWHQNIDVTSQIAFKKARNVLSRKSKLREAKEEMQHLIATKVAADKYFGRETTDIEALRDKYEVILESIRSPRIRLEAVAYIWMVKR